MRGWRSLVGTAGLEGFSVHADTTSNHYRRRLLKVLTSADLASGNEGLTSSVCILVMIAARSSRASGLLYFVCYTRKKK
jgi:hypothetical protein